MFVQRHSHGYQKYIVTLIDIICLLTISGIDENIILALKLRYLFIYVLPFQC